MNIQFKKTYRFAYYGNFVTTYEKDEECEVVEDPPAYKNSSNYPTGHGLEAGTIGKTAANAAIADGAASEVKEGAARALAPTR